MSSLALAAAVVVTLVAASSPARAEAAPPRFALKVVHALETGRWPEGVVLSGDLAWVADSGDRRLAAFDLAAPVPAGSVRHVKIGRLPTVMARQSDGTILVLVNTDKRVSAIRPGARKASPLPVLPDCPEDLAIDQADRVFVLLWSECSNVDAHLARLDAKTGKATLSPALGRGAEAVTVVGERAYVAHSDGHVSVVATDTLAVVARHAVPGMHQHVRATPSAVYVDDTEKLLRLDAATGAVTHERALGARIGAIELRGTSIFAALNNGEILELDAADLRVLRVLVPEGGAFEPRTLAFHGEHLLVTTHRDDSKSGDRAKAPGDTGRLRIFAVGPALEPQGD